MALAAPDVEHLLAEIYALQAIDGRKRSSVRPYLEVAGNRIRLARRAEERGMFPLRRWALLIMAEMKARSVPSNAGFSGR